jgi:DNA-binding response OmpR family regulator
MMPKMSGFDVCKTARKNGINTPIILLTAKGEEIDKILGLELGADDYVTKPFSLRELLARIKAILRRGEESSSENKNEEMIKIGRLDINFQSYNAFEEGTPVQLSHKEFEILHLLWNRKNTTVSRDDLLNEIWGYDESPTTRTVDNFMFRLRQKIEKDSNHPHVIITVHGIGYKLII